ncbi:Uncharacterised protein [Salmonella enterica subsp. enterica serovar Bovismorbificans]|uniref:Uncharacterized protein n=1 Tax=Salmonella enterica subsp. enterica serovar Bovismorbificans TaxID=58097 RepID=A0A655BS77_SALET|nr:Uncharacterised protein [Salmonella enterica subsp. enterica serovar Bovismorbificans]CPR41209.1 Uncharacterised protein [Salmonella enterica subsp. enterica serovar Bovismorbificans]
MFGFTNMLFNSGFYIRIIFNTAGHRFKHRFCLFFHGMGVTKPVMIMFSIIHFTFLNA